VLSAGAVMTLFLDEGLRVRWFTPAICELFPLTPNDVGRRITDFSQKFEDESFLRDVRTVMQTDQPREAEVRNVDAKWFLRRIRPYLAQTAAGVAVTFTDISDRKRAEGVLRASAARQAFLLKLADALRSLHDPADIQRAATRVIGEHLGADRAMYAEIMSDGEMAVIHDKSGIPVAAYGSILDKMRAGWTMVCPDIEAETNLTEAEKLQHRKLGSIANVSVSLVKGGRWVAGLGLHCGKPRRWTDEEVALVRETAERTWMAVDRARAEEELLARNDELERFNNVTVGRELRVIELKKEVNALRARLDEPPRYPLAFEEVEGDGNA
jgi:two-component system CheB/CheR fusion protein